MNCHDHVIFIADLMKQACEACEHALLDQALDRPVLRLLAGALMVAIGLRLAGWTDALRWIERTGASVWRLVAPLARRWVPIRSPATAFALGLVWGLMPCGLIYAALAAGKMLSFTPDDFRV